MDANYRKARHRALNLIHLSGSTSSQIVVPTASHGGPSKCTVIDSYALANREVVVMKISARRILSQLNPSGV